MYYALKYAVALSRWRAPPGMKRLMSRGFRYELFSDEDPWDFWTNNDDIMRRVLTLAHIPGRDSFPHVALQQFVTSPFFVFYQLHVGLWSFSFSWKCILLYIIWSDKIKKKTYSGFWIIFPMVNLWEHIRFIMIIVITDLLNPIILDCQY